MNVLASECSGGSESGWTLYLEHSFLSPNGTAASDRNTKCGGFCEEKIIGKKNNEEEEEDLSMVSDASSGPPHFHEDQIHEGYLNDVNGYQYPASRATTTVAQVNGGKRQKKTEHRCREKEKIVLPSFLDDTASSPFFNFSSRNDFDLNTNNQASMESVLDYSQAFSATHFQGRSASHGFLQPSSLSGNHLQITSGIKVKESMENEIRPFLPQFPAAAANAVAVGVEVARKEIVTEFSM